MADQTRVEPTKTRTRTFLFTYSTTVTGLAPGKMASVWIPLPPSNEDQTVQIVSRDLPAREEIGQDPKCGNKTLYVEARASGAGTVFLAMTYRVTRREVKASLNPDDETAEQLRSYLQPDAYVPIGGEPLSLLKDRQLPKDQLASARLLYDVVNGHMRYSKQGTGWGRGDAVWACQSGYGNCSDFHSLFISLARTEKIPAKFEIGFPLPVQRGSGEITGYHCWAKFHPAGHGWIPVDISEANKDPKKRDYYFGNLTENRVEFSTGRDLELVPRQKGKPLNFLIFPYVEVDNQQYPADKVKTRLTYQDLPKGG
jgi:hypothetical protein